MLMSPPKLLSSFFQTHNQLTQYLARYRSRLKAKNLLYIKQILFVLSNFLKQIGISVKQRPGTEQKPANPSSKLVNYVLETFWLIWSKIILRSNILLIDQQHELKTNICFAFKIQIKNKNKIWNLPFNLVTGGKHLRLRQILIVFNI
jgi:hypothetical protein